MPKTMQMSEMFGEEHSGTLIYVGKVDVNAKPEPIKQIPGVVESITWTELLKRLENANG